jgi:DNA polymerase (family 10)
MENLDVAQVFERVADLLEIQGENPFRIRAYRNAARTIESLGVSVAKLAKEEGGLTGLPGIGKDLAGKIRELCDTGRLGVLVELTAKTPESLAELIRVPGLGPRRARQIYEELGIGSIDELERAARAGRLHQLSGIGIALEARLLQGITDMRSHAGRFRLAEAEAHVAPLLAVLRRAPGVQRIDIAGSYRRRRETVGDIDILIAATPDNRVADHLIAYPGVKQVLARGDTRCAVVLRSGLQVDVRIVAEESYGAALHYFTGSKPHSIAIRALGIKRGLKINEYGVFRGSRPIAGRTEEEVFASVGLPWIPPELREDRGEIAAALRGALPKLVEPQDLRGDLQMHTTASDGRSTLDEMVEASLAQGRQYIAITDHTPAVRITRGLGPGRLREQARAIDRLQERLPDITILKSAEVDILEDGRLDLDDAALKALDIVLVAIHTKLRMPRDAMTRRMIRALGHPRVHILAHPTARLIGRRPPVALDMEQVIRAAADRHVMLEVDAQPDRLDLDDIHVKMAKEAGVKIVISSDAHHVDELKNLRYGVDQARRGWCEPGDIANTLPLPALRALLQK